MLLRTAGAAVMSAGTAAEGATAWGPPIAYKQCRSQSTRQPMLSMARLPHPAQCNAAVFVPACRHWYVHNTPEHPERRLRQGSSYYHDGGV